MSEFITAGAQDGRPITENRVKSLEEQQLDELKFCKLFYPSVLLYIVYQVKVLKIGVDFLVDFEGDCAHHKRNFI